LTAALDLRDVTKRFGATPVLENLSLQVGRGEYVTLLGPSGSGKSTLLRIIAGFETPDDGAVLIDHEPVLGQPAHQRGVGFVFQSFALFPHLSVFDNVAFGLVNRVRNPMHNAADIRARVEAMLELVGLKGLGGRLPTQISGGQKQRVAFARTLVTEPRVVLLDEPLGALDANLRERMMLELRSMHDRLGATFLHVTGNEQEALAMGSRVAVLEAGRIAQIDSPETLIEAPRSAAVARLVNCYNVLDGRLASGGFAAAGLPTPLPATAAAGPAGAPGRYCIRYDRIDVLAPETPAAAGDVQVAGKFLASEYAGARLMAFFDIGGPEPFEVEYHLGHRRPPDFSREAPYALRWKADRAIVFADR
jgi:ABC-type Fe3+/spermidine/putrescine transport system ATPase subunit